MSKKIIDSLLDRNHKLEQEAFDRTLLINNLVKEYADLIEECNELKEKVKSRDNILERHQYQFALMRKDDGYIKSNLRNIYPSFFQRLKLLFWRDYNASDHIKRSEKIIREVRPFSSRKNCFI